ncbi:MAG: 2-oxo acid dehydrogenase subunit E2 [Chloroflexi bacterium]|nr:2-oxo acid dehydrogenase subunit E2 [Chloroflexota bacterium]
MANDLVMPRLSDTMEQGTITRWLKREGEAFRRGEPIAEIQTDKANMELEAFDDGVLQKIVVNEGQTVNIGEMIALLGTPGDAPPADGQADGAGQTGAASDPGGLVGSPAAPGGPAATPGDQMVATTPRVEGSGADASVSGQQASPNVAPSATAAPSVAPAGGTTLTQPQAPPSSNNVAPAQMGDTGDRTKASPLARRLAQELGVELTRVQGTGPGGRIIRDDVEQAHRLQSATTSQARPASAPVAAPQPEPAAPPQAAAPPQPAQAAAPAPEAAPTGADVEVVELSRMQLVVARRMTESKQQAPHFYVTAEIDMAAARQLGEGLAAAMGNPNRVPYNEMVLKACALALRQHPDVNVWFRDGRIERHKNIHVGFAVALEGGLLVPVIRNTDQKSIGQIAADARAVIEKARAGKLTPNDYEGGTFTVSNLGMFDVDEFNAIVNPPQVAILAVGSVKQKPVVKDGQIVIGERMRVTLSADHRAIYGATAAQFLQELKRLLELPFSLVI